TLSAQQQQDDLLDIADVTGKRIVSTRLHGNVTIREENGIAALEVMSRFAANPKWLIYLPPTMSPPETTRLPGLLEHPAEAFAYFRHEGIPRVICEEKNMASPGGGFFFSPPGGPPARHRRGNPHGPPRGGAPLPRGGAPPPRLRRHRRGE